MTMLNTFDTDFNWDVEEMDVAYAEEAKETYAEVPATQRISVEDALVMSLNRYAKINIAYMVSVTGLPAEELVHSLESVFAIFPNPLNYSDDPYKTEWLLPWMYLRGNVFKLLKQAKDANRKKSTKGRFSRNITFLKKHIPETPEGFGIYVSFGATWLPVSYTRQFIAELLGMKENQIYLEYNDFLSKWKFTVNGTVDKVTNNYLYGTSRMNAVNIIRHLLNAIQIKVFDPVDNVKQDKTIYIVNPAETLAAQKKGQAVLKAFEEWVHDSKREDRISEIYSQHHGLSMLKYEGSWLKLSDINPDIELREHQRDAIARVLVTQNGTGIFHDMGAGKTYVINGSVHELKRTGVSNKNLVVCPNNTLDATIKSHYILYPQDNILAVYPQDFEPSCREEVLHKIREGDYVAIYMASSTFDMLTMSKQYQLNQKLQEIDEARSIKNATRDRSIKKIIQNRIERMCEKYQEMMETLCDENTACFDTLGITALVVDECHNYKNIHIVSSIGDSIVGMHCKGSEKANHMMEKVRYIQNNCENPRIVFLTGTPIVNSMADLYTIQSYLQPDVMQAAGTDNFLQWCHRFCQFDEESSFEVDVDCGYRFKQRFSQFHNLTELLQQLSLNCDFYHMERELFNLPDYKYIDIVCPRNKAQISYMKNITDRVENIRTGKVKSTEDNLLKITSDGKRCALDIRMIDDTADAGLDNKIIRCAQKVYEIWKDGKVTQMIFCDIGTPKKNRWNVYDELKKQLLSLGIPDNEIAFIHDATDENKRRTMIQKVNDAKIRILIGSTPKIGLGINVQKHMRALHYLSIPWRTGDMQQRLGRGVRQGNMCSEVDVYRYVTEKSFDAYLYQILENKQKFISCFLSGNVSGVSRDLEGDFGNEILDYASIKSLAIGDEMMQERVDLSNAYELCKMAYRQRQKELREFNKLVCTIPNKINKLKTAVKEAEIDLEHYHKTKTSVSNEERIWFGEDLLDALRCNRLQTTEAFFGEYEGAKFDIFLPANMTYDKPYIYIKGSSGGKYRIDFDRLDSKEQSARGVSAKIDYFLNHFEDQINNCEKRIQELQKQMTEVKYQMEKGNEFEKQMQEMADKLCLLDKKLREKANK